MPAAYDTYDYPSYWIGRDYEQGCEVVAIKKFLEKISRVKTIVDIGAGFGRLTPYYSYRAKKIILVDPSSKLLKIARLSLKKKRNISFIQASAENLRRKLKSKSTDLAIVVRVLHHVEDLDKALFEMVRIVKKGGYLILEFPNKRHLKAVISEVFKGNFTFPLDIFPKDLRTKRQIKKRIIPFINYHPDAIVEKLEDLGMTIVEKRSVSNIRVNEMKKIFSLDLLLSLEEILQVPMSYFYFGPSIFILAKRTE